MRLLCAAALLLGACTSTPPVVTCTSPDQVSCGGYCAVLATDDAHCGSCDTACNDSSACAAGACYPKDCPSMTCDPMSVCVDDRCVDKSCVGVICPVGQVCSQGACACASDRLSCAGSCVDPKTDDANCGACGKACPQGQLCAAGACFDNDCSNQPCDPTSVCYQGHCTERACVGVLCPNGEACVAGACGCVGALSVCGGACVDTRSDSANCGACGKACAANERCAASACFPKDCAGLACGPLEVCADGACVDARCVDVQCGAGEVCSAGACTCAAGLQVCGGSCVDVASNPEHCGACGHACSSGQACVGGACGTNPCNAGQSYCGGTCVDLDINADHCGACGAACGGGRNCVGRQCVCPAGLTLCGTQCTNLNTDPANCGACGNGCNGGTCGTGTPGRCTCPAGKALCNGSCADFTSDDQNCGGCGLGCSDGGTCVSSVCTCPSGQRFCGGRCIDVSSDNLNCGNCNAVCATGRYCSAGTCQLPITCQTSFNAAAVAACPYFPLLNSNCGAETVVATQRIAGRLDAGSSLVTPITTNAQERITVFGTEGGALGAVPWSVEIRNSAGQFLDNTGTTGGTPSQPNVNLWASGSSYPCGQAADVRINSSTGPVNYDLTVTQYHRERWNTGSPGFNFIDAGMFDMDGGVVCGQLCGDLIKYCGDIRQNMALVVPPNKAVDLAIRIWTYGGGSNMSFELLDGTGAYVCGLFGATADGTQRDFQARVVNNTNVPQKVHVSPYFWGVGGNFAWHVAAASEP